MLLPCKYHHELNLQQPLSIFLFPTEYMLCCCAKYFSCVLLFVTLGTTAHQAPLSMGFSRQEYWNGLLFTSSEDPPNPGIKSDSPTLQADSLLLSHQGSPQIMVTQYKDWLE